MSLKSWLWNHFKKSDIYKAKKYSNANQTNKYFNKLTDSKFQPSKSLNRCDPPRPDHFHLVDRDPKIMAYEIIPTHHIHVWYVYLHLVDFYGFHVGKYTSPMDPMGYRTTNFKHPYTHLSSHKSHQPPCTPVGPGLELSQMFVTLHVPVPQFNITSGEENENKKNGVPYFPLYIYTGCFFLGGGISW